MPEGPSILILKEQACQFIGEKVIEVSGNAKIDLAKIKNKKIVDLKTWGKHFLICFKGFTIRIHLMMFGSYSINEIKEKPPRLSLTFKKGNINFYNCSVKIITENLDQLYDWSADVMNPLWSSKMAEQKLMDKKSVLICDALLDQEIFSGVGNIIKNEVLYRVSIHPLSVVGKIPIRKIRLLINETVKYAFQFLEWKKEFSLKKHWLAYRQKICGRDQTPFKNKHLGTRNRRSFFCPTCQKMYD